MKLLNRKNTVLYLTLSSGLLLAACGSDEEITNPEEEITEESVGSQAAMENFEVGDTFEATEPLEISMLYRDLPAYPLEEDWMFFEYLENEHNVIIDPVSVPLSDWEERLSVTVSAGDMPDYSADIWAGQETPYVPSGAILPISDYVHLMPHFSERLETWDGVNEQIENLRHSDGKYYMLPGLNENVQLDFSLKYNETVFNEHDLEEPETWEDLRAALEVLRDETGSNAPMTLWWQGNATLNFAGGSFDTVGGWGFGTGAMYDEEQDEFVYAPMEQGYKDMVEYFAGLTEDGLLDIEATTQDDEMARNKLINLDSFVSSGNVGTLTDVNQGLEENYGEGEYEFSRMRFLAGPNGQAVRGSNTQSGIMLNANITEDDDFLAKLQFLDWLHYSDEGTEYSHWGVEGETFEMTDERATGYKPLDHISYEQMNPGAEEDLQEDYGYGNVAFAFAGPAHIRQSIMDEDEFMFQERMNEEVEVITPDPPFPMSQVDQESAQLMATPLQDTVDQYTLRFITGQYSLDRWDEFMSDLENQNVDQYMEMVNESYRDFQESLGEAEGE